jgi:alpha-galactosidase
VYDPRVDGVITAANLHNLILPRQSQIWAVLRKGDTAQRLTYSLAATFLGRMCLSGDVGELSPESWELVNRAMALYQNVAPIIKSGISRRLSPSIVSMRHPTGYQAVLRTGKQTSEAFAVVHTFENAPREIELSLPEGNWSRVDDLLAPEVTCALDGEKLKLQFPADFSAAVVHLRRA